MKTISLVTLSILSFFVVGCGSREKAATESRKPAEEYVRHETPKTAVRQPLVDDSILTDGLQATLKLTAERAVEELGRPGAFSKSELFRINLPESFAPVKSEWKKWGQEQLLTDFEDSHNEAARQSVMAFPTILANTIQGMKMEDVLSVWEGGDDAATRYLESRTRTQMEEQMLPIIAEQTAATGSTKYFQQLVDLAPKKQEGLLGNLSSFTGMKIPEDFDLNEFVSEHALNALCTKLAIEEARIREPRRPHLRARQKRLHLL